MSQRGRVWAVMAKIKAEREAQARTEAGDDQKEQTSTVGVSEPVPTLSRQEPPETAMLPIQPTPLIEAVSPLATSADPPRSARGRAMAVLRRTLPTQASAQAPVAQEQVSPLPRSTQQQQQQLPLQQQPSSAEILSNLPAEIPKITRQGSDLSTKSSLLSQHFASVDSDENYKARLSKEPSSSGQEITLSLNYMTFNVDQSQSIEEYHVDFSPSIESIRLRYHLLRSEVAQQLIGSVLHWTGTNLYLPTKLEQRVTSFQALHPVTNVPVEVRLTHVKTPPDSELLPFYNSLMHKVMNRLRYVVINRQHYSPVHKISIQAHNLEVWPGWITTIQRLDGGLKLSVDASFRVLRLETVRDLLRTIKNNSSGANLIESFNQQLVGSIVMTRYNNKAYRIDEITASVTPRSTFLMDREQRSISYADYMREHWNVQVNDLDQPMIVHRPKPKRGETQSSEVLLIPELCVTTGLTDEMRSNFNIMKAIHEHTRLPPNVRESKLTEFLQQLATDERASSVLGDWNLSVKPVLDVVKGRRLDPETVFFGQGKSFRVPDKADWTRPATSFPVFKNVDINDWVVMFTERDAPIAEDFLGNLREVSRAIGIKFSAPRICRLPNDSAMTYVNFGKREVKTTDQMVVLLTPGRAQREDRYSACKRLYSCEIPVPCQFIRCGTIANPQKIRAICQKIVLQILCKVGGQPWAMRFPMQNFMIVGVDVYHDTIDRKRSCVGFVASMNKFTSQWWSQTFFQNSLEEIAQKLGQALMNAIKRYHSINGSLPQRIIIYRDGVGDSQMETVIKVEVAQLMSGIKIYMRDSYEGEAEPHVSYVLIQKRINAKMALRQGSSIMNPPPGSYIDHTITHPEYNDFYLVSQHVNQGTVSPTKYVVLTETGTLKMVHHQKLAYKMTHMYYNWCGTVRVPAPCQYAHKLAYLCGQNIKQTVNANLDEKLYYL